MPRMPVHSDFAYPTPSLRSATAPLTLKFQIWCLGAYIYTYLLLLPMSSALVDLRAALSCTIKVCLVSSEYQCEQTIYRVYPLILEIDPSLSYAGPFLSCAPKTSLDF